jgi:hypothetical protein
MKTFALALATFSLIAAAGAHAEERAAAPAQAAAQPQQTERTASAEAPLGRDGQQTSARCSKANPFMEYRDCVNASTRDPNAKVRMG